MLSIQDKNMMAPQVQSVLGPSSAHWPPSLALERVPSVVLGMCQLLFGPPPSSLVT